MELSKITSAIINDLYGGTAGFTSNPTINYDQIEDEVVEKRIAVIKELYYKGLINPKELAISINCIPVDCDDIAGCDNCTNDYFISNKKNLHCEIPLLIDNIDAISYIGSVDKNTRYSVYYSIDQARNHKYKRRRNTEPFVYIDRTPNKNNMHNCWIFNAPFVKRISVTGVFKDLRQLQQYSCCNNEEYLDFGSISDEVKTRVKKDKLTFYREARPMPTPTDLMPK